LMKIFLLKKMCVQHSFSNTLIIRCFFLTKIIPSTFSCICRDFKKWLRNLRTQMPLKKWRVVSRGLYVVLLNMLFFSMIFLFYFIFLQIESIWCLFCDY
jgi:hypothetical protein